MNKLPCQGGQAMAEYLVISLAMLGLLGWGHHWVGEGGGLLGWMLDALRGFHQRFATAVALPL